VIFVRALTRNCRVSASEWALIIPADTLQACKVGIQPDVALREHRQLQKQLVGTTETLKRLAMAGQGSTGNVIAALCSFFIPGLGQLIQGRLLMAIIQFILAGLLWIVLLGWLVHLWSILDAAMYKPRG